jgi:hypothetical protein
VVTAIVPVGLAFVYPTACWGILTMRLIGSLTEDRLREELSRFNAAMRAGHDNPTLSTLLRDRAVDLATAFVLDRVPGQSEDIYTVLDSHRQVLTIELPRGMDGASPVVETISVDSFREVLSKGSRLDRLRFAVAVDLSWLFGKLSDMDTYTYAGVKDCH